MEGNMEDGNFIELRNGRCDYCSRRYPGGLFHHRGTPVLFLCIRCQPSVVGAFVQSLFNSIFGGAS